MSDLDKRLSRLEGHIGGAAEQIQAVFTRDGESAEDIWGRDHPGEAYPDNAFVVRFVSAARDGRHDRA